MRGYNLSEHNVKRRRRRLGGILVAFIGILLVAGATLAAVYLPNFPLTTAEGRAVYRVTDGQRFNFVAWEAQAIGSKLTTALTRGATRLDAAEQRALVEAYLARVANVRALGRQLEAVYVTAADPQAASAALRTELAAARAAMVELQPLAEFILQEQVSQALKAEGFSVLGGVWPPVQTQMTPLPLMLIVSPREQIEQRYAIPLQPGLSTAEQDAIERRIFDQLGLSALVVPIGGLGVYPAMIIETANLVFLTDVIAHEWSHHWLTLRPVGLNYATSGAMRTINETAASIVGGEIGRAVLATHYPEALPPPAPAAPPAAPTAPPNEPPPFDFRAEMRATRVRVDALLAARQIEQAETYMEERRQLFVANGYALRKLNQAYFAFHGAYADTPGAGGGDPVGPTVVAVREASGSLRAFLRNIAFVTSFEELQAVQARLEAGPAVSR